jgi:hypothetical protein
METWVGYTNGCNNTAERTSFRLHDFKLLFHKGYTGRWILDFAFREINFEEDLIKHDKF